MKSVLITGTSRGIGLETALAFGRAGYTVHATMRNPSQSPRLSQTAAEQNLPIHITAMDVDSDDSVRDTIAAIEAKHGPIDVLVNNAGMEVHGAIEQIPFAQFRAVMETNYFGALRCIQALVGANAAAPKRLHHQHNLGCRTHCLRPAHSLHGVQICAGSAERGMAGEMKPFGVRVAIVEPGIIDTRMAHQIGGRVANIGLPAACAVCPAFRGGPQEPGAALGGSGQDPGNCRDRNVAIAPPGRTDRGSLPRMAQGHDRRRMGRP